MPEKGEELYKILKADPNYEGVGSDYNKFKEFFSDEKNYTNLYNTLKADPNYEGIGKDANAFSEFFGLKKKDFQGFSQELPKPTMPSGEKFTQGIGLGVKPISSTVSPSASKQPKSTIPSASTGVKTNLDYLRDINSLYKEKINTSQQRINAKRELLALQPEIEDAYSKIESLSSIYNDENLSPQERNDAAKAYNALVTEFQPMKSKYDNLVLSYNDLVKKDKQEVTRLKEIDNQRQLQLQKEFNLSKDLLEKTGKGFVDAAAGISGIFNTLGLSGDPESPEIQEEVKEQTRQNIEKIRSFGNSLVTQETPKEWQSIFEGKFSPKKLAYVTSQAVSSTIPTVAAGLFTGGAGTALAGAGMGFNESKDILKEAGLNDSQAEWASLGLSIPLGLLEEYGAGDIVKILSSPVIKKKVANELVKNLAGKKITKELLFVESKKSLGKVIKENAGGILNTGYKESMTEMGQGTLQEIAKQTAQEYTGVDPDQEIPFSEYAKSFAMQRAEEGVGGFLGGTTLAATGKGVELGLSRFQTNFTPTVYSQAIEFRDPEKLQEFQEDLEGDIAEGLITPEQAQEALQNVQAIVEADNLIPNNIIDNDIRTKAVNLIIEKNNIERDIEGKDKSLVTPLSERVKEIDEQLVAISKGEKIEEKALEEITDVESRIEEPIKTDESGISQARQQFIKDNEIEAFQEKFGYKPYNPFESLPNGVYETILRVEDNTPTSLTAIEEASNWLYSQYKMLEAKKVSDTRDMTMPQIDEVLSELEGAITELENFKNKLYEESGEAKRSQDTTTIQAVDGQTSEGVRLGKEIITPSQEVTKSSEPSKSDKKPVKETVEKQVESIKEEITPEQIETGRQEVSAVKEGKIETANPIRLFKGLFGKRNPDGTHKSAHPNAKGVFSAVDEKVAERYKGEDGMGTFDIPAGTTMEVIRLAVRNVPMSKFREQETEAINASDAQIVKLITTDAKGAEEQYVIKDPALIEKMQKPEDVKQTKEQEDAVQKQTTGQVPVQPETEVSEGVEGGKPKAEPKEVTEESKVEEVDEVKVEKSKKAFEALLKEESASPTAKKKASELKKEAGDKAVKEAAEIMENIDSIRQQLLDAGVIKSINCKWG